jgi:DNA-binding MarR family transcriptional regulator
MSEALVPEHPMVRRVQRAYPQIYLACHVRHVTVGADGLSTRDAAILAHLDELSPVTAGELARHLGIGAPTLSEALERLEELGLATRSRDRRDRRQVAVRITVEGVRRMQATSVLDSARVTALLSRLPPSRRAAAVRGIELIAAAARDLMHDDERPRRAPGRPRQPSTKRRGS